MAHLVVTEGDNVGAHIPLSRVICIGRGLDMDVMVDDLTVSKRHARIVGSDKGDYILEDLGSSNGTLLNGMQATTATLQEGDEVKVGVTVFRFTYGAELEAAASADETLLDISTDESATSVISSVDAGYETSLWEGGDETSIEDLAQTNRRLRTLLDISQAIGTGLDEGGLLKKILDNLLLVFPESHRGFIILRDPETGKLSPAAVRVVGSPQQGGERLEISATILEYVLREKRAVLSSDAMSDDRFPTSESIMDLAMRSVMCAPLMVEEDVLGFILLDAQRVARNYDEEGLTLLAGIANQAALTIANARLHSRLLQRERLEQDLRNAHRIQNSFLPKEPPQIEGYEFVDWYGAALEVGGDFYDFVELPDDRVVIVVGDVSGKGITAALMMAKMTSNVRFLAGRISDPAALLQQLNEVALESASDMFVTVLIMVLDYKEHVLTMANAGHCFPVMAGPDGSAEVIEAESGFPVGIAPNAEFPSTTFQINEGHVICAFTDGIVEAMSEEREQFGYGGLTAALAACGSGASAAVKSIQKAIRDHAGSAPQSDDLTLICLGRHGNGSPR